MRNYFKVNGFVDLQLLVILRFRNLPFTTKLLIKQVQKKKNNKENSAHRFKEKSRKSFRKFYA